MWLCVLPASSAVVVAAAVPQAASHAGVTMVDVGDDKYAPADVVIAAQLSAYGLHPKQLAWVMHVSAVADHTSSGLHLTSSNMLQILSVPALFALRADKHTRGCFAAYSSGYMCSSKPWSCVSTTGGGKRAKSWPYRLHAGCMPGRSCCLKQPEGC